jgi:hypothetical protein
MDGKTVMVTRLSEFHLIRRDALIHFQITVPRGASTV